MFVKLDWLESKTRETIAHLPDEEIDIVVDALLWAETTGNSDMGIIKLAGTEPIQDVAPSGEINTTVNKCAASIHGHGHAAPYTTLLGVNKAIELAKHHGVGITGVTGIRTSTLCQTYYLEKIAAADLIGFMCSRSPAVQTGFNSIEPLFGTNPFGFSFPSNEDPFLFDPSTSSMTWYDLIVKNIQGVRLPELTALDDLGNYTCIPQKAMEGALLLRDRSQTNSMMAMTVELLAGPLVGAAFMSLEIEEDWGTFIMTIDPDILCGTQVFKQSVSDAVKIIKESKAAYGTQVRLPGEDSLRKRKEALEIKRVDIDERLLKHVGFM